MAKKPFKKLFGKRVVISADFIEKAKEATKTESGLELIGEAAKEAEEKKMAEHDVFDVIQVGDECHEDLKEGVQVYIEKAIRVVNPETAEMLFEDGKLIGLIVAERDIAGIL